MKIETETKTTTTKPTTKILEFIDCATEKFFFLSAISLLLQHSATRHSMNSDISITQHITCQLPVASNKLVGIFPPTILFHPVNQ